MSKLRHSVTGSLRLALGMTTVVLLAILSTTAAFAAGPAGTVQSGGIAATGVFSAGTNSITLDGHDHNAVEIGFLQLTANDFTGIGAGWSVTTSAPALTSGTHPPLNTSLSTSSASAGAVTCAIAGGSCSTAGVSASTVPLDGSTQTLASANARSGSTSYGMGSYNFTDGVVVDFPANAYAGDYSTIVTLTMAPPVAG